MREAGAGAAEVRRWLFALAPLTTGMLAQKGLKLAVDAPEGRVRGVVGVRDQSVVYPVLPEGLGALEPAFARQVPRLRDAVCVMGPTAWTRALEPALAGFQRQRSVDYLFLVRPAGALPAVPDAEVTRARPRDATRLFPLQEGYEKEEVLFSPTEFQPVASWLSLQKTLREQVVLVLSEAGRPIAQARTNARFGAWSQIGGVYTDPAYRRRGHQKVLMVKLLDLLASEGQGACLFVKTHNRPALDLYLGLGFRDPVDFEISYWAKGNAAGALPPKRP